MNDKDDCQNRLHDDGADKAGVKEDVAQRARKFHRSWSAIGKGAQGKAVNPFRLFAALVLRRQECAALELQAQQPVPRPDGCAQRRRGDEKLQEGYYWFALGERERPAHRCTYRRPSQTLAHSSQWEVRAREGRKPIRTKDEQEHRQRTQNFEGGRA